MRPERTQRTSDAGAHSCVTTSPASYSRMQAPSSAIAEAQTGSGIPAKRGVAAKADATGLLQRFICNILPFARVFLRAESAFPECAKKRWRAFILRGLRQGIAKRPTERHDDKDTPREPSRAVPS